MKHNYRFHHTIALTITLLGCGDVRDSVRAVTGELGTPGTLNTSLIGRYDFGADQNTGDLAIAGDHAYVARRSGGFAVVDIADRAAPTLVTTIIPAVGATDVTDVATQNIAGTDYLFVGNYAGVPDPTYGNFTGVYIYSLANRAAPALVRVLTYGAGAGYHFASQVRTLTTAELGGRAFLFVGSVMTGGIVAYEVTNPTAPTFFTSIIRNRVSNSATICDIVVQGSRLYAAWRVGFAVYDLSAFPSIAPNYYNPAQPPTLVAKLYTGAGTNTAVPTPSGDYVLTTDDVTNGRVRVWDVRVPSAVVQVSALSGSTGAIARHVAVRGNLAWVANQQDGLRVFDLSNPAAPISLAWFDTDGAVPSNRRIGGWDVIPNGDTAWFTDSADGLHAVNLEDTLTAQSATWSSGQQQLVVRVTSSLQPRPTLTVTGFGPMTWVPLSSRYELTAPAGASPGTVTVTSSYGATRTVSVVSGN
jgi:hypothetical protein